jgi:hypothetical protein
MKILRSIFLLLFFLAVSISFSEELTVNGKFNGENVFIENPSLNGNNGFSISEIWINGKKISKELQSNTIEIDLVGMDLKEGQDVNIRIVYSGTKKPFVINTDAFLAKCSFTLVSAKVDKKKESLEWQTKSETCQLPYVVEHLHWGKWLKVGEIQSKGIPDTCKYSVKVPSYGGGNLYRIRQINPRGEVYCSKDIKFRSSARPVNPSVDKDGTTISFSDTTYYEVYSEAGTVMKKGFSNSVNISDLAYKSLYILNYDNDTVLFYKQ